MEDNIAPIPETYSSPGENFSHGTTVRLRTLQNKKYYMIGAALLVVVVLVVGFFMSPALSGSSKNEAAVVKANNALLAKIARHIIIPTETPIIATINDAGKLVAEQAFYTGSADGDKLVIFPQAQKAIIYSPSRDIIINAGPFVVNSGTSATTQ